MAATPGSELNPADAPVVLVADNDTGVNELLCEVLSQVGLRTESVGDGQAALSRIAAGGVRLLVCDLDMPVVSGIEVVRRIPRGGGAPRVVVVSGYVDARLEHQLRGSGVVAAVFRKPFDLFAFADEVAALVRGAGSAPAGEAFA